VHAGRAGKAERDALIEACVTYREGRRWGRCANEPRGARADGSDPLAGSNDRA
jgi:hypothetical protein